METYKIVVGTYEKLILAYKAVCKESTADYSINPHFNDSGHNGCVTSLCISQSGQFLASASSDEILRIFDLKKNVEIDSDASVHKGTINHLQFFGDDFLFTCCEDSNFRIWKIEKNNCTCMRTLTHGHIGSVKYCAIHPCGKLALTIGIDKKLITWNLVTGRRAYITNLKSVAEQVHWAPDGSTYIVLFQNTVNVYTIHENECIQVIVVSSLIQCCNFLSLNHLVLGLETGQIEIHQIKDMENSENLGQSSCLFTQSLSSSRIKDLKSFLISKDSQKWNLIVISSDQKLAIWNLLASDKKWTITSETSIDVGFRPISLAVVTETVKSEKKTKVKKKKTKVKLGKVVKRSVRFNK